MWRCPGESGRRRRERFDGTLSRVRVESLGFQTDLAIRRLGGSEIISRDDRVIVRTPSNPGYWWGNFILLSQPVREGQAAALRRAFMNQFPGANHMAMGVDGTAGEVGDQSAVDALGLSAEITAILTADRLCEPARHPATACWRTLQGRDDWVHAGLLRRACDDQPDTPPHRLFQERQLSEAREVCEAGHGAWFGAFVGSRLVSSLGLIRVDETTARYQSIETHPQYRRQGIAGQLIYQSSQYGAARLGARRFVIAADPSYHAIDIYRRLGFEVAEQQVQLAASSLGV